MFQFIEKGMRGGVSYITNRYGKENNKYMKEYDEKAPTKHTMYLDAKSFTDGLCLNICLRVVLDGLQKKKSTKQTWLNTKRIVKRA